LFKCAQECPLICVLTYRLNNMNVTQWPQKQVITTYLQAASLFKSPMIAITCLFWFSNISRKTKIYNLRFWDFCLFSNTNLAINNLQEINNSSYVVFADFKVLQYITRIMKSKKQTSQFKLLLHIEWLDSLSKATCKNTTSGHD